MFKVNNKNNRTSSAVFVVNFEHISHLFLAFLSLTSSMYMFAGNKKIKYPAFGVSIANFEQ